MKIDTRERFTLRLPKTLFDQLKEEAYQQGHSVNALILQILWDWIKREGKQDRGNEKE